MWLDARLPIRFGVLDTRAPGEAVVTDQVKAASPAAFLDPGPGVSHAPDCACCVPRSTVATVLARLFRDRAVSAGPPFRGVLAVVEPENQAAIRAALVDDPLVSARYRLADEDGAG